MSFVGGFFQGLGSGLSDASQILKEEAIREARRQREDDERARKDRERQERYAANRAALEGMYPGGGGGGGGLGPDPRVEAGFDKAQRIHTGGHSFDGLPSSEGFKGKGLGFDMGKEVATGEKGAPGTLASALLKMESDGYDTLFGHSQRQGGRFSGVRVSSKSLADLYEFSDPSNEYGQWVKQNNPKGVLATPMGIGQIVGTTLRRTADEMGLPPDTVFTPEVQHAMIAHLAMKRIQRGGTMAELRKGLRNEWDGFNHMNNAELDQVITNLQNGITGFEGSSGTPATYQMSDGSRPQTSGLPPRPDNSGLINIAADERVDSGIRKEAMGRLDGKKEKPTTYSGRSWIPDGDGYEVQVTYDNQGNAKEVRRDGKRVRRKVKETKKEEKPNDLSSSLYGRLESRFSEDFEIIDPVAGEILRLMKEENLSESEAEIKAIGGMVFEDEVITETNIFGKPKATETRRNKSGEGSFTGKFEYSEPEPQSAPQMPRDPGNAPATPRAQPRSGAAPVVSQAEYDALPSGAKFIAKDDPSQKVRIKP